MEFIHSWLQEWPSLLVLMSVTIVFIVLWGPNVRGKPSPRGWRVGGMFFLWELTRPERPFWEDLALLVLAIVIMETAYWLLSVPPKRKEVDE